MAHFVNDDKLNLSRLPTGWQFLTNNVLGGTLNSANFAPYDSLVQPFLATGAYCILDVSVLPFLLDDGADGKFRSIAVGLQMADGNPI